MRDLPFVSNGQPKRFWVNNMDGAGDGAVDGLGAGLGAGRWDDAMLSASLFAVASHDIGGIHVRARPGPVRNAWLDLVRDLVPAQITFYRLPLGITADRLLGGIDLAATLSQGRPVFEQGVLARADGGVLVAPMAERMNEETVSNLARALDTQQIVIERDGVSQTAASRLAIIAIDEAAEPDECPPAMLLDRLALTIDLEGISIHDMVSGLGDPGDIVDAIKRLGNVTINDEELEAVSSIALSMGIHSLRPVIHASVIARAHAALEARDVVEPDDIIVAARLVLAPKATMWPSVPQEEDEPQDAPPPEPEQNDQENDEPDESSKDLSEIDKPLEDVVLEAIVAAMPDDVLAHLRSSNAGAMRGGRDGRAGAMQVSKTRGRPAGTRRGARIHGQRMNILETLRASAPWQRLRGGDPAAGNLKVLAEDFRFNRYKNKTETTTIFVVDASGSSALNRLAEIKGAVELLLADCYVRRDEVSLIAFRGTSAEMILPPTRSLLRAKKELAGLPGGGGTPLASGLDAALALAEGVKSKGRTPVIVVMTDGGANVGRDGQGGRAQAASDAASAARMIRATGISSILIDTAKRPHPQSKDVANEMDALYIPLPRADAKRVADTVNVAVAERV